MSDEKDKGPNPYNNRDHDSGLPVDKSDVMAVAGLLGQLSGELREIDNQQVGSDSSHVKANKIDPREALKDYVTSVPVNKNPHPGAYPAPNLPENYSPPPIPDPVALPLAEPAPSLPPPPVVENRVEVVAAMEVASDLADRVKDLESIIESYKKIIKFKRGISYTITTSKIKGEFKDPTTLLDLISTEIAKQTKVITLRLNDTASNKK